MLFSGSWKAAVHTSAVAPIVIASFSYCFYQAQYPRASFWAIFWPMLLCALASHVFFAITRLRKRRTSFKSGLPFRIGGATYDAEPLIHSPSSDSRSQ